MSSAVHLPAALSSARTSPLCGPRSTGDMRPLCRSGPRQRISVETIYGHLITIDPGQAAPWPQVTSAELPPPTARPPQRHLAITGRSELELAARSAGLPKLRFGVMRAQQPPNNNCASRSVTVACRAQWRKPWSGAPRHVDSGLFLCPPKGCTSTACLPVWLPVTDRQCGAGRWTTVLPGEGIGRRIL